MFVKQKMVLSGVTTSFGSFAFRFGFFLTKLTFENP